MSRVTLKQVANQAGVSFQTVSKVLNGGATVSKETEARILETARALGYHPNLLARSLRSQRSRLIGYSWEPGPPDQADWIVAPFLQSMAEAAEGGGYHLLAFAHPAGKSWAAAYRELIDTRRVDGFVLSSVEYDDARIQFLQERRFPFVAFGRSNPGWEFPYVDIDGAAGMRMVVEHLAGLGHRRIAALAWPESSRVGQNRMEGFRAGLQAAGLSTSPEWIARGEGIYAFGREAAGRWLDAPAGQRPTAIVGFNDSMAVGALDAARERGYQTGVDLAITGFEDAPSIRYLSPGLTSVRQPIREAGQQVIALLLELLAGAPPREPHRLLLPELVVRGSSAG